MSDKMNVSVSIVPLEGKPKKTRYDVPVTVTGTTVAAIAKVLKIDLNNKSVMVDGEVATGDTVVKPKAKLEVTEIRVTERPQGS